MSDDKEIVEEVVVEEKPVELSPMEERALAMGWRPKAEFTGDEEDFIDAKEFVRRKPLFDKIEQTNKVARQATAAVAAMKEHYNKVEQAAYQRALKDLKAKQSEAVKEGDLEKYHELQEEIDTTREQAAEVQNVPTPQVPSEPDPMYTSWKSRNDWYQTDQDMTVFADAYGIRLANEGMQPAAVLKAVEDKIRSTFPAKFTNPNRSRPGAVEPSKGAGGGKKGTSYALTDQERQVMKALVKQGVLTEEKYIADLRKVKGE